MEGVEEANKSAVESCHRVLSFLCQPQDQVQYRNLMMETEEAVFKFKRVVSLLNNGFGHERVRKFRRLRSSLPQSIFLETPNYKPNPSPKPLQLLPTNFLENPLPEIDSKAKSSLQITPKIFLESQASDIVSSVKPPLQIVQQKPSQHYQFLQQQHHHHHHQQQQQQIQRIQFQKQQMKYQADMMYSRSNSGINLKFDGSSCTPTMSSTRSFISSLSMDGSVANLDGNSFHLIGVPQLSDPNSHQPRRRCSGRGEDGSVKCGSSGKCHCSKRRKLRVKRSIKVPAISNKVADIPPDEYFMEEVWAEAN
uniref:Zn-cluster domain-containing protein n=1 Tax=Vitis vinifera TaxID=29760 RepID=A5AWX7_VITVI|nr:hypothetical protein VITISV_001732 [Vitis vinifera]